MLGLKIEKKSILDGNVASHMALTRKRHVYKDHAHVLLSWHKDGPLVVS